jgi:hypothetical protein
MRADGNAGAAVGARAGIELPDPHGPVLVVRTWIPKPDAPERHSPAPPAPQETAQEVSVQAPGELPAPSVVPAPRSSGRGRARRGLECAAGCGVPVDPDWAARTGRDRHGWCLGQSVAGSAGGAR